VFLAKAISRQATCKKPVNVREKESLMPQSQIDRDTAAWIFYAWASFIISTSCMMLGIYFLPVDMWIKGYMAMGTLFTIGATFTLSKTIRDNHEVEKMRNRVASAKTEKILHEYELKDVLPAR
jgi:hypothetical protein